MILDEMPEWFVDDAISEWKTRRGEGGERSWTKRLSGLFVEEIISEWENAKFRCR